jgi:tol-pal system protein YbgF
MHKPLLAVVILLPLVGGCATKRDIRDLQAGISQMQASQEQLLRELQRQNAAILDSLNIQDIRVRGDFTNQLVQIERQLVQIQELTGQGQQRLNEMREALRAREAALQRAETALEAGVGGGDPDELFATAEGALQRGSLSTARAGFEEFVRSFPQHSRTPEARLFLAEIRIEDGQLQQALEEYSRITELHPNAPEAASALFRAALIERDRGNSDRARQMLNQLTAAYPGSPEASDARDELRRIR